MHTAVPARCAGQPLREGPCFVCRDASLTRTSSSFTRAAGPAFLDSLIAQTASAAGIEEGGLRDYIEFARRQSLITQLAQNAGVPEEALADFMESYGTR